MELTELVKESLSTLALNKLRTGLATLGIIIGIGSVITLISLGQSGQKSVQNQIESLGSNLLTVEPGSASSGFVREGFGSGTTLTHADANALANSSEITTISTVSPELARRAQVVAGRNNENTQIIGVTPTYASVHKASITSGVFISQRDVDASTKNVVVGPDIVTNLFGEGSNPLGQTLRINGIAFNIVGVTESKGGTGFQNPDTYVYVPLTTAQSRLFHLVAERYFRRRFASNFDFYLASCRYCGNFTACRRYWNYEYHVGNRDGKNA